jgi:hypothetical protein
MPLAIYQGKYAQLNNKYGWMPASNLILTFDDISNVPVTNAMSVNEWNTFFDLPTYGTPFTSVSVEGNEVTLKGGKNITLRGGLFANSICETSLIHLKDMGCIVDMICINEPENYLTITPFVYIIPPEDSKICRNLESASFTSLLSIGNSAFTSCIILTSITLSNSVTSIENEAFHYCFSLSAVTLGNNVTSIGNSAFASCESLTSITLPNSVASIGNSAFAACKVLTSIIIPDDVTTIGSYTFAWCQALTSIVMPNNIISIGNNAFEGCTALTSITIPINVTSIGTDAFANCSSLNTVNMYPAIAPTVNADNTFGDYAATLHISYDASGYDVAPWTNAAKFVQIIPDLMQLTLTFDNISNAPVADATSISNWNTFFDLPTYGTPFTSVLVNGNEVTLRGGKDITLRGGLFADSTCATSLIHFKDTGCVIDMVCLDDMENGIEISPFAHFSMPEAIMNFCRNLESASFTSLLSIRDVAFIGCESLALIDIPFAVTSIGNAAFADCPSLNTINMYPPIAPTVAADSFDDNPTAVLHTPPITSGYDIEPWTNTAKFSTILTDVYGDIII